MRFFGRSSESEITPPASASLKSLAPLPTYPINASASSLRQPSNYDADAASSPSQSSSLPQISATSEKLRKILEEYDPKISRAEQASSEVFARDQKGLVRRLLWEDILFGLVRVQRHEWVLGSGSEKFRDLRTPDRWNVIHEDLERYVKAIGTYDRWLSYSHKNQLAELEPAATWSTIRRWGKTLAIFECAEHHASLTNTKLDPSILEELTRSLSTGLTNLSKPKKTSPPIQRLTQNTHPHSTRLVSNLTVATIAGGTLVVPALLIVLGRNNVSMLFTTSTFALAVGLILACRMGDAQREDVGFATGVYVAVWMVLQACEYSIGVSG